MLERLSQQQKSDKKLCLFHLDIHLIFAFDDEQLLFTVEPAEIFIKKQEAQSTSLLCPFMRQ